MDKLDVKILRELALNRANSPFPSDVRVPYRTIAERLQVDEDTVRNRIKKFDQIGFLRNWQLAMNPNLIGLKLVRIAFDFPFPTSKEDLIRKLKLIQGVLAIITHFGRSLGVILSYENEKSLRRQIELIQRMSNAENLVKGNIPLPECGIVLSKTDWNIIRSLQRNPHKPYHAVSKELGLSSKTVKRRLDRLIREKAIFLIANLNPKASHDVVFVDLLVFYTSLESKSEVDRKISSEFDEYLVHAELTDTEHGLFVLVIRNVSKAQEILSWVKEQDGVREARVALVEDRIELYELFNEQLEKKFAQILA